jgi:hypothetical protein
MPLPSRVPLLLALLLGSLVLLPLLLAGSSAASPPLGHGSLQRGPLAHGSLGHGSLGHGSPGQRPLAPRRVTAPNPLIWQGSVADPAVVRTAAASFVVMATGPLLATYAAPAATGPWALQPAALTTFPSWVKPGDQWAPDLVATPAGWVLYYAAPAYGSVARLRCIGTAVAPAPTGPFAPASDAPLVCPPREGFAPAEDELADKGTYLPAGGVIDPSVARNRAGQLVLLYKTQSQPTTIRALPLTADGLHAAGASRAVLSSRSTVENPVMTKVGRHWVLFTSEGDFAGCDYVTTWRRSTSRWKFPRLGHPLLEPDASGICGPGGADVVMRGRRAARLYFHGWVCWQSNVPCPLGFRSRRDGTLFPRRALYGAAVRFDADGRPELGDWLTP